MSETILTNEVMNEETILKFCCIMRYIFRNEKMTIYPIIIFYQINFKCG